MKYDKSSELYEEMISNQKLEPGLLNGTVLLLWLTAVVIVPYESEGVYYTMIGAIM